jgi:F-type H+-transporting ATPase subunit b
MAENTSTAGEATPPSEHGAGFPPFQADSFASQLLWLAIFFGALYLLAAKLALPRVGSIIDARRGRIGGDLAAATRMRDEAEAANAAYEKTLADARARAQATAAATREKLDAQAAANRKEVEAKFHARLAEADQAIAARKAAAMASLPGIAEDAAVAIIMRLTGTAPPQGAVAGAVAAAIKR